MTTRIQYNSAEPWRALLHDDETKTTPYISISIEPIKFGTLWANIKNITLDGTLYYKHIDTLHHFKSNLISTFSINGKDLRIYDDDQGPGGFGGINSGGKTFRHVFVDQINFPEESFIGKLNYSISLRVYDFYDLKIIEPTDQMQMEQNRNKTVTVTHQVSAKGIDNRIESAGGQLVTSGMGNARSFVESRIDIVPALIHLIYPNTNYMILEETGNHNRLTSTFSITKKYLIDTSQTGTGIENKSFIRYSTSITKSINNDFEIVEISAECKGGMNSTSDDIVSLLGGQIESTLHSKAQSVYGLTLYNVPENLSIEEDLSSKSVSIKATFDNNTCFGNNSYYFDYEVSINIDNISDDKKVEISGELIARGSLQKRNSIITNFISAGNLESYLYTFANLAYSQIVATGELPFSLNPKAESLQISHNKSKGALSLSASFTDVDYIANFSNADWEINVTSPIPFNKAAASTSFRFNNLTQSISTNGYWSIQDFGFNTRQNVSCSTNLTLLENPLISSSAADQILKLKALDIKGSLFNMFSGEYYLVSETVNLKLEDVSAITMQEDRSYGPGPINLIKL